MFTDRILLLLIAVLLASVAAFLVGVFPYPFGFIILTVFILARILYLRDQA